MEIATTPPTAVEIEPTDPVNLVEPGALDRGLPIREGAGLCLSGGGYKAMLFHLGVLWRLNELGIMRRLLRISSVSGGSITAATLAIKWRSLRWEGDVAANFEEEVVAPILALASKTIDVPSIGWGLLPWSNASKQVIKRYDQALFQGATLQDLPQEGPEFVINATNLMGGELWRFSRRVMEDWTVGMVFNPTTPLAQAVAASAAFPPVLSPIVLKIDAGAYTPQDPPPVHAEHRERVVLTDGGVFDNMGLESVWRVCREILVSDAGGPSDGWDAKSGNNWLRQLWRVFWIQRYQVGRVRRRQLIASFMRSEAVAEHRRGAYWNIGSPISRFDAAGILDAPKDRTDELATFEVRLRKVSQGMQARLVNWGYAVCDAATRTHYPKAEGLAGPGGWPMSPGGV